MVGREPSILLLEQMSSKVGTAIHLLSLSQIVSVRVSIAVERHHDHCNSYKGTHLIGAVLQFQRFSPLLS